jgi:YesN/AraC family two-component response regulator
MDAKLKALVEATKKLKLLYVEDNDDVREEFGKLLEIFFDNMDTAADGREGLEKYKEQNGNYDLVISDIVMPKMDGIDMSRAILDINSAQQIIIISTYNDSYELNQIQEMGLEFIQKPVDLDILSDTLEKVASIILD